MCFGLFWFGLNLRMYCLSGLDLEVQGQDIGGGGVPRGAVKGTLFVPWLLPACPGVLAVFVLAWLVGMSPCFPPSSSRGLVLARVPLSQCILFFFAFLPFLGPLPTAYGGSQARG